MTKRRRRTRLKDLTAHDQAEIKTFKRYLKLVSTFVPKGTKGNALEAQRVAYEKIYGEVIFDETAKP